MWETMAQMGFRAQFIDWFQLLYSKPVCVQTNRGLLTPEGYPAGLSTLTAQISVAMAPLTLRDRQIHGVGGKFWGLLEEKMLLYANYAIYLDGSDTSFCTLMQVVEGFGDISGLKVGWDKSIVFLIGPI